MSPTVESIKNRMWLAEAQPSPWVAWESWCADPPPGHPHLGVGGGGMQQIQPPEDGVLVTVALRWKRGAHPSFLDPLLRQKGYPLFLCLPDNRRKCPWPTQCFFKTEACCYSNLLKDEGSSTRRPENSYF